MTKVVQGCDNCADPVTVALREKPIERRTASIAVFKCPQCGCLILDDILGWKGSGVVFRATPEMIEEYVKNSGEPDFGEAKGSQP